MSRRIAFVDDETKHIGFYLEKFASLGITTRHFKSPDSCLTAVQAGDAFDAFVIDLMMPSYGVYSTEDTEDGLLTGLLLAKNLRADAVASPLIIFTNLNIESVLARVQEQLDGAEAIFLLRKADYLPAQLAETTLALLDGKPLSLQKKNILRRLWDSLLLKPSIFGLGIDLKELGRSE